MAWAVSESRDRGGIMAGVGFGPASLLDKSLANILAG